MKFCFLQFGILLTGAVCCVCAPARGDTIPNGYAVERYSALWQHSPFTLASVQQPAAPGFAANLAVVATATIDDEQIVTFVDRVSHERFTVGGTPNEDGIKVVSVDGNDDPLKTRVTLQKGSDTATVGYDRSLLAMVQGAALPAPFPPARMRQVPFAVPTQGGSVSQSAPLGFQQGSNGGDSPQLASATQGGQQAQFFSSGQAATSGQGAAIIAGQGSVPNSAQLAARSSLPIQEINDIAELNAQEADPGGALTDGQTGLPQTPAAQIPPDLRQTLPIQEINDLKILSMEDNDPPPGLSGFSM